MNEKTYNYAVFIGRFQPLHNGHIHIIGEALAHAEKIIVLIGSANAARSVRNPFTYVERESLLEQASLHNPRILISPLDDHTYNDNAWIAEVQSRVFEAILRDGGDPDKARIALAGYGKDNSSYYIKLFPQWGSIELKSQYSVLNSTNLRDEFLTNFFRVPSEMHVPKVVAEYMSYFVRTEEFKWLVEENKFYQNYRNMWAGTPFPVVITCVDAIVIQSGHILLVKRKHNPGKGLLALPGGHVNVAETFIDAAVRELKEETRISDDRGEIPPAMLKSFIDDSKTRLFDDPHRSMRGRVVTNAYYFELPNRKKLFEVRGDDDAESASWHSLGTLDPKKFFEDHYHIIKRMT